VRPLRGCLNDTKAVETFLLENLNVPSEQIKILRDSEATREGIIAAFTAHLINNPAIQKGDQIFFHYSGHGARVRDLQGLEPDGYHESLVAYDSRTPNKCDLLDKELGELLDGLAQAKGSNITVILDSCHSGSGTRDLPIDESMPLSREIEPDERPLPPEVAAKMARLAGGNRSVTPSVAGWTPGDMPYVLIAGCRDEQLSREYEGSPTLWNGALTYFALEFLKRMPPTATYRDLHETVSAQVNGIYKSQEPQCEGQRDRKIFGGVTVERYPFIKVTSVEGKTVHLDGGIVHDLREGTELALYLPDVRTRAEIKGKSPLVRVRVVSADVTTAEAEIIQESDETRAQTTIPPFARAVITAQAYNPNVQKVALLSDGTSASDKAIADLRTALEGDGDQIKPSLLIQIADVKDNPPFLVKAIEGKYSIYDGDGKLLLEPIDFNRADDPKNAVNATNEKEVGALRAREGLEGIARHRAVLNLKNDDSALLDSDVKVALRQVVPGSKGRKASDTPEPTQSDGSIVLSYDPTEEKTYAVEVRNNTGETLFANIFLVASDYGIYRLYPNKGQNDSITGVFTIGLRQSGEFPLGVTLLKDQISSTEYLKVILTPEPTDLAGLSQDALALPGSKAVRGFGSFLDSVIHSVDGGTRGLKPVEFEDDGKPWVALTVPVKVVRKGDSTDLPLNEKEVALPEDAGAMTLEKPAAFTGKIKITSIEQEARALGDVPTLPLPASLAQAGYQMVQRPGSRSTDPARIVLEIEVEDDAMRRSITPDNPLKLHLGDLQDKDSEFLPIYFDGESFLPAGYAMDESTLVLTHLPPTVASATDEVASRGFANAIKLYLFNKKLGRKEAKLGLHAVEVDEKGNVTRKSLPKLIKAGEKVCLFVHGFTSDSESIVPAPYQMLQKAGKSYDHYLSFDYESFGTSVPTNAVNLAHALRDECGLDKDDGITVHMIAHSMGGFTTRYFIQSDDTKGYEIVDKVILAGAPNNGTPLAMLANGGFWVAAFLLNHVPGIPFGNALGDLLTGFHEDMAGLQDLKVGSVAAQLFKSAGALPIPFLVLSGQNSPAETSRWQALANKVVDQSLDKIFGEENDVVIGLSSLRQIGIKADPNLTLPDPLPCNHSGYFNLPEVVELAKVFL